MCIRDSHKMADEDSPEMAKLSRYFEDPPSILMPIHIGTYTCLLYTSDAADERSSVDLGGRRIIKKKKQQTT